MASDQERPIEKLLRRAARQRGDQAAGPWELHPANRRILQDEVARRFPQPENAVAHEWNWARLWPRFVWAGGLCALLAVTVWTVFQDRQPPKTELALGRSEGITSADSPAEDKALPPGVAGMGRAWLSPSGQSQSAPISPILPSEREGSVQRSDLNQELGGPEAVVAGETSDSLFSAHRESEKGFYENKSGTVANGAAVLSVPKDSESSFFSTRDLWGGASKQEADRVVAKSKKDEESTLGFGVTADVGVVRAAPAQESVAEPSIVGGVGVAVVPVQSQEFYGNFRLTSPRPAPTDLPAQAKGAFRRQEKAPVLSGIAHTDSKVLTSFRLNQTGEDVVVVDNDGSVYRGRVQTPKPIRESRALAFGRGNQTPTASAPGSTSGVAVVGDGIARTASAATSSKTEERGVAGGRFNPSNAPATVAQRAITDEEASVSVLNTLNFKVAGTNKTLSRNVEFDGTLLLNNASPALNVTNFAEKQAQAAWESFSIENRVTGRVLVEGSPPRKVEASQVP